jgi:hypothetical protein
MAPRKVGKGRPARQPATAAVGRGRGRGRDRTIIAIVLLAGLAGLSCRRAPHFARGDAAAVVVVQRPRDAGGPPSVAEREPNNTAAEAQELTWAGTPPAAAVRGTIERIGVGEAADIDVFKVVIPGQRMVASSDAGHAADLLLHAKRLSVVVNPEAGLALALDFLDETQRLVKAVAAGPGEAVGLPNMAVMPGCTYYLRAKAAPASKGRSAVDAGVPPGSSYQMTVLLLDFELADEREPNDRPESASELSWQGRSTLAAGFHGWRRDEDWYRLPLDAIEPGWVLNLDLEGVEGVAAGLTVNDSAGRKIVAVRGRKGERLALHNLVLPSVTADAGAAAAGGRWWYVVVRAESGLDRERRYVLRADAVLPDARGGFETEPNDDAAHASFLADGTTTGTLPLGDVDFFRYRAGEPRELDIEVSPPPEVRVKVEVIRELDGKVLAESVAAKARQVVRILGFSCPVGPILIRLSHGKHDGNASEPYLLKVASRLSQRDAGRRD